MVIVSPSGDPRAFPRLIRQSRLLLNTEVFIIFDPGQDLSYLKKKDVIESLKLSNMIILNDIELDQLKRLFV